MEWVTLKLSHSEDLTLKTAESYFLWQDDFAEGLRRKNIGI